MRCKMMHRLMKNRKTYIGQIVAAMVGNGMVRIEMKRIAMIEVGIVGIGIFGIGSTFRNHYCD